MAPIQDIGTLHYIDATIYKAQKAMVAAKYNGIALNEKKFKEDDNLLQKNPVGKVPYLETDMGCVFTSNAIARYIARCRADTNLYGKCFDDEGQIDTWMEFCTHELEVPLMTWIYPVLGLMEDQPAVTKDAIADVKKALKEMENALKANTYLIGDFLTLADITLVCALKEGFVRVFDAGFRKEFKKVESWFTKCCKEPQFKAVLGDVKLCEKAEAPKPFTPPAAPKAAAKAEKKQEQPKKKEEKPAAAKAAPAPAAAPAAAGGAVDEAAVKAMGDEIRVLKEKLKAEGLSGKKINDHPEVKAAVEKLNALKAGAPAAAPAAPAKPAAKPAAAAAPAAAGGAVDEAAVKAVGDKIRTLKEKLKGEGLSGKKINEHPEIKVLVDELTALKAGGAPAAASAAPAPAAPAPAAAAGGGDVEAQIKALGDEIRACKEKLKGQGITGKKLNDHPEIKEMVDRLTVLKAKM